MEHRRILILWGYFLAFATGGLVASSAWTLATTVPTPTLPPIEVTVPGCEWGGPYPGWVERTEMWIVICAEGGRP